MNPRTALFPVTAFVLAVSAFAVIPAPASPVVNVVAGESVAPLILKDLDGKPVSLASLRGSVVLLNFWATWCKPCMEEMPVLADLATRYRERGLAIVAASVDDADSRSDVARIAAALPEGMQVWLGATPEDMQRLNLGTSLPATLLLDRDGRIIARQRGGLTAGALDSQIESLLKKEGAPKKFPDAIQASAPRDRRGPARS